MTRLMATAGSDYVPPRRPTPPRLVSPLRRPHPERKISNVELLSTLEHPPPPPQTLLLPTAAGSAPTPANIGDSCYGPDGKVDWMRMPVRPDNFPANRRFGVYHRHGVWLVDMD
jgi:hypothetical protein